MPRDVTQLFRRALESRMASPPASDDLATRHWEGCLIDAGVELQEVIRVRPDTRGVFLVRHPDFGSCVMKTVLDADHADRGFAQAAVAQTLQRSRSRIFPEVLHATSAYTLERFIEGRPLRRWWADAFDPSVVAAFFEGLRAVQPPTPVYRWGQPMDPQELRSISAGYLRKNLNHLRYLSPRSQVAASARIVRQQPDFARRMRRVWSLAETAAIPRLLMCGDMGYRNILVTKEGPARMVNVDYEFLGPGHWGFDACYLASTLANLDTSPPQVPVLRDLALDANHVSETGRRFFLEFLGLLCDVSCTIFGHTAQPSPSQRPAPAPRVAQLSAGPV